MTDPELLLLDEPAAGLDLGGREELVARAGRAGRRPQVAGARAGHAPRRGDPARLHAPAAAAPGQGRSPPARSTRCSPPRRCPARSTSPSSSTSTDGRWSARAAVRAGLSGPTDSQRDRLVSVGPQDPPSETARREGVSPMGWLWWIGAALVLGILEMLSLDLVLVMFAGGASPGAIAYVLGAPVAGAVRRRRADLGAAAGHAAPVAPARTCASAMPLVETNAAALVGREAVVVSTVTGRGWPRQARRRGLERPRRRRAGDPARHRGARRRASTARPPSSRPSPASERRPLVRRAGSCVRA